MFFFLSWASSLNSIQKQANLYCKNGEDVCFSHLTNTTIMSPKDINIITTLEQEDPDLIQRLPLIIDFKSLDRKITVDVTKLAPYGIYFNAEGSLISVKPIDPLNPPDPTPFPTPLSEPSIEPSSESSIESSDGSSAESSDVSSTESSDVPNDKPSCKCPPKLSQDSNAQKIQLLEVQTDAITSKQAPKLSVQDIYSNPQISFKNPIQITLGDLSIVFYSSEGPRFATPYLKKGMTIQASKQGQVKVVNKVSSSTAVLLSEPITLTIKPDDNATNLFIKFNNLAFNHVRFNVQADVPIKIHTGDTNKNEIAALNVITINESPLTEYKQLEIADKNDPESEEYSSGSEPSKNDKKSTLIIVLVVLGVVAAVAVIIIIVAFVKKGHKHDGSMEIQDSSVHDDQLFSI